jgi:hypothetical protein
VYTGAIYVGRFMRWIGCTCNVGHLVKTISVEVVNLFCNLVR